MLKRLFKFLLILLILFTLATNFTILRFFLPQHYPHIYCADKCKFWFPERAKGHDPYGQVIQTFEHYKKETNQPNLVLYRRFYRKWWQVWNWVDFLTLPCFDLPYAERDEDT
jgi:hypothetical protein